MAGNNTIETARELTYGDVTQENAQKFLDHINNHFPNWWEQNEPVRVMVLDYQLKVQDTNEFWTTDFINQLNASKNARWALATSLTYQTKSNIWVSSTSESVWNSSEYTYIWNTVDKISDSEYKRMFEYASDTELAINWNRNLFIYQVYINNLNNWISVGVDGQIWAESREAMQKDVFATQYFLRILEAKGKDGEIIKVDWDFGQNTRFAINSIFANDLEVTEQETVLPVVLSSVNRPNFAKLGITEAEKNDLTIKIIPAPQDIAAIKKYQSEHSLIDDGVIGAETYLEMDADRIVWLLRVNKTERIYQNKEEIIRIFENGNPLGHSFRALKGEILSFKETFDDSNGRFTGFFNELQRIFVDHPESNPYVDAMKQQAQASFDDPYIDSDGFLWDIPKLISGEITPKQYIDKYKWPAAIIFFFAYVFFGSKIPGMKDLPGSGSFLTRLPLAGLFLAGGGFKLLDAGVDKAMDGVGSINRYIRSDKAQKDVEKWQNFFVNTWNKLTSDWENGNVETEEAWWLFDTVMTGMEKVNNNFQNSDIGKYIKRFEAKSRIIVADPTFIDLPSEEWIDVTTLAWLELLMSEEWFKNLMDINPTMTDKEVEIFIKNHLMPVSRWASNTQSLKDFLFIKNTPWIVKDAILDVNIPFDSDDTVNTYIQSLLSPIVRTNPDSELSKVWIDLAIALQVGSLDNFEVSNYSDLNETDSKKLQDTLDQIRAIKEIKKSISERVLEINNISIVSNSSIPENKVSLEAKLENLETLKDYTIPEEFLNVWDTSLDTWMFNIQIIERAYLAKRLEIFTVAWELLIPKLWSITVSQELSEVETQSTLRSITEEINSLSTKFEWLNLDNLDLKEFKAIYDSYKWDFVRLKQIKQQLLWLWWENNSEIILEIDTLLNIENSLKDKYWEIKKKLLNETKVISIMVSSIATMDSNTSNYSEIRTELESLMQDAQVIQEQIEIWYTFNPQELYKQYILNEYITPQEKNLLVILDKQFANTDASPEITALNSQLKSTVVALESNYKLGIDINSIDITTVWAVGIIVDNLKNQKELISWFANETIRERKIGEIADIYKAIQNKYVVAITNSDNQEVRDRLFAEYNENIKDEVQSQKWVSFSQAIQDMFKEDPVEVEYEKVTLEKELEEIYSANIETDLIAKPVKELLIDFFTHNQENAYILNIWNKLDEDDSLTVKGLINGLELYVNENNPLYITNNSNRRLIEDLLENIKNTILEIN